MYAHYSILNGQIAKENPGTDKYNDLIILEEHYLNYRSNMESVNYELMQIEDFDYAANEMNEYLLHVDNVMSAHRINAQTKLRSSVLEELSTYLFKNNSFIVENELEFFNKEIYAGVLVERDLQYRVLYKDVDFCIGKTSSMAINGVEMIVRFPFVCIEAKTYLDSTMHHEALFSGTQLKTASPDVKTYVLMEYQDEISKNAPVPASYSYAINGKYNLRACKRPSSPARRRQLTAIEGGLLKAYYSAVVEAL
ncbi:MAG: Bpu10I family restriction endonuclease [Bacillota bacterium]|nr:Bpu10I family restriction endonuclease [Bacillota bacterium]